MPALITRPGTAPQPVSGRTVVGVLMITLGVQWFLKLAFGIHVTLWVAVLGQLILQRWFTLRRFPALVVGGVLVGIGLGEIVQDLVPGRGLDDLFGFVGWGFGFLLVASLGGRGARWAYPVAAVFGVAALGSLGLAMGRLLPEKLASVSLPLFVLLAGVLLLSKGRARHRAVMLLVAAGCLLFASSLSDSYREIRDRKGPVVETPVEFATGSDVRTVFIATSGTVTVRPGETAGGTAMAPGRGRPIRPVLEAGRLVLEVGGVRSYDLRLPRGTNLVIRAANHVDVEATGGSADIDTSNGNVTIRGAFTALRAESSNGRITGALAFAGDDRDAELETSNGDIVLTIDGDPEIDAESDNGEVRVDGRDEGDDYERDGDDGTLDLTTDNGSITLTRVERVPVGLR